jgi:histidinol-phosphatase (PHP family)
MYGQEEAMNEFIKYNYHAHTWRCQHAYGTEREYIEAAIEMGIKRFGFSDHIPSPAREGYVSRIRMRMDQAMEYRDCIRALQKEYADRIEILVGFEAEYVPKYFKEQMRMFDNLGFDYLIMGQHFIEPEEDGVYTGSPTEDESRMKLYVDSVIEGIRTGRFLYIAHPDIMNYRGLGSVYEWEMSRLCEVAKEEQVPLEINLLGIQENKIYPRERFWKIAAETGNDVVLGLDAHCVEQVQMTDAYRRGVELADKYGLHLIDGSSLKVRKGSK